MKRACTHCQGRWSRRRNGLCDACNVYRSTYGHLPSEAVLVARGRRDLERLITRRAG